MNVLVFKTDVVKPMQVNRVQTLLTKIPAVEQWNFDLEDCDNILRIVSTDLCPRQVETVLQTAGIYCEELL